MKTLSDWLAHCERLHPHTIDMGLERVRTVAQRMGLTMPCPVITVAGTNGKGSTVAMLESILRAAGYRTGVYTSPHLVHFEERMRINGEAAAAEQFVPGLEAVEQARAPGGGAEAVSLTYFEFTTLAVLWVLARSGLDAIILEVGLGGRLDAVNIVDPDCAVITSIDLDHMSCSDPTARPLAARRPASCAPVARLWSATPCHRPACWRTRRSWGPICGAWGRTL